MQSGAKGVVVAVCGVKNSGKTTLIESMIPKITAAGLQVAVIKHDGHSFIPDDMDSDTGRHYASGACATAIFDGEKCKVVRRGSFSENDFVSMFPEADLILLEGFKYSSWPKLELVRRGISEQSVCRPSTLLALVSDLPLAAEGVTILPFGDGEAAAELILNYVKERRSG